MTGLETATAETVTINVLPQSPLSSRRSSHATGMS